MASETEVKEYLAYWFQLGKGIVLPKSEKVLFPQPVFEGTQFSEVFEQSWQQILANQGDCYLEGTEQTIHQLLSPAWELVSCARCTLPMPFSRVHPPSCLCPCADLSLWPNSELPLPKLPTGEGPHLRRVQLRLQQKQQEEEAQDDPIDKNQEEGLLFSSQV